MSVLSRRINRSVLIRSQPTAAAVAVLGHCNACDTLIVGYKSVSMLSAYSLVDRYAYTQRSAETTLGPGGDQQCICRSYGS